MGTFYSNIRLLENGIKPLYVFDGKPPSMKSGELEKRAERRVEAKKQFDQAESTGKFRNLHCSTFVSSNEFSKKTFWGCFIESRLEKT